MKSPVTIRPNVVTITVDEPHRRAMARCTCGWVGIERYAWSLNPTLLDEAYGRAVTDAHRHLESGNTCRAAWSPAWDEA